MLVINKLLEYNLFRYGNYHVDAMHVLQILCTVVAVKFLVELFAFSLRRRVKSKTLDKGSSQSILQILKYILWTGGIIVCLQILGINISLLLAGSAALLVGVGLGLQQTFNDFFSGIVLLLGRSIKAEDIVELDGEVCTVVHIGLRTSNLLTRGNINLIVPNSKLTSNTITNWTAESEVSQFVVGVGISYNTDIHLIQKILLDAAREHTDVVKEPHAIVRLTDFGDSALQFELLFWSSKAFRIENVKSDLRFAIIQKLRDNNVEIPFPQRDLHIKTGEK